ncbi:MAG: tyrosine-type recombinase/integrase [Negativicutes bacterium]|nr:tyrosine-type recombinase/integrase [Negativicutes bacterium]
MASLGSMQKRGKDVWRFVKSYGFDKEGKPNNIIEAFRGTEQEARVSLVKFVLEVEKGYFLSTDNLTFEDFTKRWFRDYAEKELAPKTVHRYKTILESRVLPVFGGMRICEIQPAHLMEFYRKLSEEEPTIKGRKSRLSPRTILHHHRVISAILSDAVEWQIIDDNPTKRVKPPRVPEGEIPVYDEDLTQAMLKALADEPLKYRTIVMLALATGLRQGEIFGLEWQDIEFDNELLHVRRVSAYLPGIGIYTKPPKTKSSKRTIVIPQTVSEILRQHKAKQNIERLMLGEKWCGSPRLFTTWEGKPMLPKIMSDWFPRFLRRKKLPHMPFHGLRHLAATYMIAQGSPIRNVADRLGHSRVSTTLDIYSRSLKKVDREIADKVEEIFKVKPKAKKK